MKQFYFKSVFLSLLMVVFGNVGALALETWVATAPGDLAEGDVVVIVDLTEQVALPNNGGTSSAPSGKSISLNTDKTELTGTIDTDIQWTVKRSNGDYQFYASESTWLYANNTNNGVRVGDSQQYMNFTINSGYLYQIVNNRYVGYSPGTSDWRCYTSINSNIDNNVITFFKKVESTTPALIAINETNFPDENFRTWVAENCDKAPEGGEKDGYLDDEEIAAQVIIGINNKNIEDLKGIEYFTAATMLMCDGNKLQTLDVSKNTKLTQLICYGNKLTSLNVSKNTALTSLHCSDNQLTSLNVSNNTELGMLLCQNNQLTSLDVTNNQKLTTLDCSNNLINETEMGKLVESMPTISGNPGIFYPFNQSVEDANVITTTQVNDAKGKNWNVQAWNGKEIGYLDYAGVEPTPDTNEYYEKVTTAPSNWSGEYLIVYEEGSVAFNSSLQTLDAPHNTIEVEMDNGKIKATNAVKASAFTIEETTGGYSIKSTSGNYIGVISNSNGLKQNTDKAYPHNISISEGGDAVIAAVFDGSTMTLRFNSATNDSRFRYYKTGQKAIQLYKKATGPKSPLASITVKGATTEFMVNSEFVFDGKVIATYEDGSTNDVTNKAEFTDYNLSTAGNQVVTVSYTEGEVTKTTAYNITVSEVAVENITIDPSEANVAVGKTLELTAVFEPANATNKNVIWSSSNESVATVDENGVVAAVALGEAVITAASAENTDITATCTVTVVDKVDEPTTAMFCNVFFDYPAGSADQKDDTKFEGDADGVKIVVNKGTSTAPMYVSDGELRVYNGNSMSFTAPNGYDITKIVFTPTTISDWKGSVTPNAGTMTDKTWTGKAETVVFSIGATNKLTKAEITLAPGKQSAALKFAADEYRTETESGEVTDAPALTKAEGYDGTITYASSDETIATVDAQTGVVTAVATGDVTITATGTETTTYNGGTASYVLHIGYLDAQMKFAKEAVTVTFGESVDNKLSKKTSAEVVYISDNEAVASIDADGKVTVNAVGSATITATAEKADPYKAGEASYTITVEDKKGSEFGSKSSFYEPFDFAGGSGGNDGQFKGNVATSNFDTNYTGTNTWTVTPFLGFNCARAGTGSVKGTATVSNIAVEAGKTYHLNFKAAPFSDDVAVMDVTVEGGTIDELSTETMTNFQWNDLSATITATADELSLTFTADQNRFFLDEIRLADPTDLNTATVTIPASGWASYCCEYPLEFTASDDVKAYAVTSASGNKATLTQVTGSVKGGVPLLLNGAPGEYSLTVAENSTNEVAGNLLKGTLSPTYVERETSEAINYGLKSGEFHAVISGKMPAGKAYLPIAKGSAAAGSKFVLVFEDTTGISQYQTIQSAGVCFDLQGRRVDNPQKGIYVRNGKKVVIK
ncbi:MAG: Ig-like domain-containing protein [Prevotella sp.]|nr:Ig-like domain-containing protein [Prevotella sp.]